MTAIIDREPITAVQGDAGAPEVALRRVSAGPDRRGATHARGLSPRLAHSRALERLGVSITPSNEGVAGTVRTESGGIRIAGARGGVQRTVERSHVRTAARRMPRGASRVDGCARRSPGPSLAACLLFALGVFAGVVVLFGGSSSAEPAPAATAHPALTSIVTVRAGQSLEQIALEIAPDRAPGPVVSEIAKINGLEDGRVSAGQTLVTPRY